MSKNKAKAQAGSENEDDPEVYESSGEEWNDSPGSKKRGNRRTSQRGGDKQKVTQVDSSESENEEEEEEEISAGSRATKKGAEDKSKKRGGGNRRTSQRASKKQKVTQVDSSESENEEEEEEDIEEEEESDDEYDEEDEDEDSKGKSRNGVGKKKKKENIAKITTTTTTTTDKDGKQKVTTVKCIQSGDYSTGSFVILKKDAQVGDPNKKPCIWRIDGKALLQKYEPFTDDGKVKHKNTSIYTGWSPLDKELYAPIMVYVHQHNNQNLVVEVNWDQLKEVNMDSD